MGTKANEKIINTVLKNYPGKISQKSLNTLTSISNAINDLSKKTADLDPLQSADASYDKNLLNAQKQIATVLGLNADNLTKNQKDSITKIINMKGGDKYPQYMPEVIQIARDELKSNAIDSQSAEYITEAVNTAYNGSQTAYMSEKLDYAKKMSMIAVNAELNEKLKSLDPLSATYEADRLSIIIDATTQKNYVEISCSMFGDVEADKTRAAEGRTQVNYINQIMNVANTNPKEAERMTQEYSKKLLDEYYKN